MLDPKLLDAIGREVTLDFLDIDPRRGTNAGHATGTLGIVLDRYDVPTELVIESDGAARYFPLDRVINLTREA